MAAHLRAAPSGPLWKALTTLARPDVGDAESAARRFGWRLGPAGVVVEVLGAIDEQRSGSAPAAW